MSQTAQLPGEHSLRAQTLLEGVVNIGHIRDGIFAYISDRQQLKQLMTLNSTFMPSVAKSLWSVCFIEGLEGLRNVCSSERFALYSSSVSTLILPEQEDLTKVDELKAQFPRIHTIETIFKDCHVDIWFTGSNQLPKMCLYTAVELPLDHPQLGLYPPETAKFQLVSLQVGQPEMHQGLIETAEIIHYEHGDEKEDPEYYQPDFSNRYPDWSWPNKDIRPLRVSDHSARQTILESVLKTVREFRLHSRAIPFADLVTISRTCPRLQYLGAIVAVDFMGDGQRERSDYQEILERLGECSDLSHLGLYFISKGRETFGFPQMQNIAWKSLKRFEYYASPVDVVCDQFGKHRKPWKPSEPITPPPSGTLEEVKLFFNPEPNLVNPSAFVAAMMEVFPIDIEVEWAWGSAAWDRGQKPYEYATAHCANAFVTWARELWERIYQEMTGKKAKKSQWPDDWAVKTRNRNGYYRLRR